MKVAALAGGVGAGKFLRGLVRVVPPEAVTVIVNTGDDLTLHGLHVSPDLDSVTYWLSDLADRDRGWGRRDETFRALEEVRRLGGDPWFSLGDLDLGTHLTRTHWLHEGGTLSEATDRIRTALGIRSVILPMSDQQITTWIDAIDEESGGALSIPFQVYWVARGARDEVKSVRFEGFDRARPAPGAEEAIGDADVVVICPSNPVVSVGPILAVPGLRAAVEVRKDSVVGVSPIVRGAPVAGMADRLMPAAGLEVTASGAAAAYRGLLAAWVIDERDAELGPGIEEDLGIRVGITDTLMTDDRAAERVARAALSLLDG
jgi:LPPG:FO 2-phospho-L-lactate transferase